MVVPWRYCGTVSALDGTVGDKFKAPLAASETHLMSVHPTGVTWPKLN